MHSNSKKFCVVAASKAYEEKIIFYYNKDSNKFLILAHYKNHKPSLFNIFEAKEIIEREKTFNVDKTHTYSAIDIETLDEIYSNRYVTE